MTCRVLFACVGAALAVASCAASEFSNSVLGKATFAARLETIRAGTRVEVKQIDLAPAQTTAEHTNSCPIVGYVARGSITLQIEGEARKTFQTGESFYQPQNRRILHLDNSSDAAEASIIGFYLLDSSDREAAQLVES